MIVAVDQGTTSTRAVVLDGRMRIVEQQQLPHAQLAPRPGYLEHDPLEIFANVQTCLSRLSHRLADVRAMGITNQRETTVCWDRATGEPLCNALVWCDVRTADLAAVVSRELEERGVDVSAVTGLRVSTYFSGLKMRWMIENIPAVAEAARAGTCCFGTVDSYLLFKLTQYREGGPSFVTDVSNASRTLLMNIRTLDWDDALLDVFKVRRCLLPQIRPSGCDFGVVSAFPFKGVPIRAVMGDQQAALYGHGCLSPGQAMCTFGTGAFLLVNAGRHVPDPGSYLATVFHMREGEHPSYALEGSVASAGANFEFLRKLGILRDFAELEDLDDAGGLQVLAAPQGLLAPFWAPGATMCVDGFHPQAGRGQLITATAAGVCHLVSLVARQLGAEQLRIGGGLARSGAFCQMLADVCRLEVSAGNPEATAVGVAALAAEMSGDRAAAQPATGRTCTPRGHAAECDVARLVELAKSESTACLHL